MEQNLLRDVLYRRIKNLIITGFFPMGSKISEKVLMEKLHAKKAPIRDAMKILNAERLIEIRAKSGTYVFSMDKAELERLLGFSFEIESAAVRIGMSIGYSSMAQELATILDGMQLALDSNSNKEFLQLDSQFHKTLVAQCRNHFYVDAYEMISPMMETIRYYLGDSIDHSESAMLQHRQLCNFINQNNCKAAVDLLEQHILPGRGSYWDRLLLKQQSTAVLHEAFTSPIGKEDKNLKVL